MKSYRSKEHLQRNGILCQLGRCRMCKRGNWNLFIHLKRSKQAMEIKNSNAILIEDVAMELINTSSYSKYPRLLISADDTP